MGAPGRGLREPEPAPASFGGEPVGSSARARRALDEDGKRKGAPPVGAPPSARVPDRVPGRRRYLTVTLAVTVLEAALWLAVLAAVTLILMA